MIDLVPGVPLIMLDYLALLTPVGKLDALTLVAVLQMIPNCICEIRSDICCIATDCYSLRFRVTVNYFEK